MPAYRYKALDRQNQLTQGWLTAADPRELETQLRQLGLRLIRVQRRYGHFPAPVKTRELIVVFLVLEQMSRAGVPLLDALASLRDSLNGTLRGVLTSVVAQVLGGQPLSQALAQHPAIFDPVCLNLIRAGEASGELAEIFHQLAAALKWQDELTAHTRNLLLYPALVAVIVLAISGFLLLYLVPQLAGVIRSLGQTLPWSTRILLVLSQALSQFWYLPPLLLLIAAAAAHTYLHRHPAGLDRLDALKLRLWLIGSIWQKIILARVANSFALLYAAGISILDALALCRDLAGNRLIAAGLEQVRQSVASGQPLTDSFQQAQLFPPLIIQMVRVGEITGNLDQAWRNVSYFYQREITSSVQRLQILLEPALTVLLGLLLGWIMLAVLLPIYDVVSQVRLQ